MSIATAETILTMDLARDDSILPVREVQMTSTGTYEASIGAFQISVSLDEFYLINLDHPPLTPYCHELDDHWREIIADWLFDTATSLYRVPLFALVPPYLPPWRFSPLGNMPMLIKHRGLYQNGVFPYFENGFKCKVVSPLAIGQTTDSKVIFVPDGCPVEISAQGVAFVGRELDLLDDEKEILYHYVYRNT